MTALTALLAPFRRFLLHRSKGEAALVDMGRKLLERPLGKGRHEASGDPRIHPRTPIGKQYSTQEHKATHLRVALLVIGFCIAHRRSQSQAHQLRVWRPGVSWAPVNQELDTPAPRDSVFL